MRIGINPSTHELSGYRPARTTVCVVTCLPNQLGYHQHRLDVIKLCLQSLIKHTPAGSYDLLVLDNGSCAELTGYLRSLSEQGSIRYLMLLTENIGRINASRIMFNAAPGEVVAYSDDDVVFYPGWLEAQLQVLDTFPRVGMVSGQPAREQFRYGNRYLQSYLSEFDGISAKYGQFIPAEWHEDFVRSGGRSIEDLTEAEQVQSEILLEYRGVAAYSTATHFQFVGTRQRILEGFGTEWQERLMRGSIPFDERIDSLGYARLTTASRYVRHVGNVVTPEFDDIVKMLETGTVVGKWVPPNRLLSWLGRRRIGKALLRRLNGWSYALLQDGRKGRR